MRMVVDGIDLAVMRGGLDGRCWLASNILVKAPEGLRFFQLPMDRFSPELSLLMQAARQQQVGLVVLVDEIDEVWGAHDWATMSKGDRHRIKQSRHYGTDVVYTAQFVDQIEKSIRNVTEEVELVRAWPTPTLARRYHVDKKGNPAPKRPWFIRGQRFRPAAVREIMATPDKDKRLGSSWHRYRKEHELLYDTDEIITPANEEALCARHAREQKEARCPECHPIVVPSLAITELVVAASQSDIHNGHRETEHEPSHGL